MKIPIKPDTLSTPNCISEGNFPCWKTRPTAITAMVMAIKVMRMRLYRMPPKTRAGPAEMMDVMAQTPEMESAISAP